MNWQAFLAEIFNITEFTAEQRLAWESEKDLLMPDGSKPDAVLLVQMLPVYWTMGESADETIAFSGWDWVNQVGPAWLELSQKRSELTQPLVVAVWPPADLESFVAWN